MVPVCLLGWDDHRSCLSDFHLIECFVDAAWYLPDAYANACRLLKVVIDDLLILGAAAIANDCVLS